MPPPVQNNIIAGINVPLRCWIASLVRLGLLRRPCSTIFVDTGLILLTRVTALGGLKGIGDTSF